MYAGRLRIFQSSSERKQRPSEVEAEWVYLLLGLVKMDFLLLFVFDGGICPFLHVAP